MTTLDDETLEQLAAMYGPVPGALIAVALSIERLATAVQRLGNASATTDYGAIENLAMRVQGAGESIASAMTGIAEALPPTP